MLQRFNQILDHIDQDDRIKVVLVQGNGESFSTGADLKALSIMNNSNDFSDFIIKIQKTLARIRASEKLFIAVLKGYVLGGGFELALYCDFRIAASNVQIGMPEINVGLLPGAGGIFDLVKLVGAEKTMELICFGNIFTADEALRSGIVNKVVDVNNLEKEANDMALIIASRSASALKTAKKLVRNAMFSNDELTEKESEVAFITLLFDTDEVTEKLLAFTRR